MSVTGDQIVLKRGTAAEWVEADPILATGEPGWAWDADELRIGDGIRHWHDLPAIGAEGGSGAIPEVQWVDVQGKPSTYPPATHSHAISDVTGLAAALADKADADDAAAALEALSDEVANKATQQSVDALSNGLGVTNGNLGGTHALATDAMAAAGAAATAATNAGNAATAAAGVAATAKATADAAKATADTAVQPAALIVKGILNHNDTPPSNGVWLVRPAP